MNKIVSTLLSGLLFLGYNVTALIAEPVDFELILSDAGTGAASSGSLSSPEALEISFRSSGVEFWASNGNHKTLISTIYDVPAGANSSVALELSNTDGNMRFVANSERTERADIPDFDTNAIYDIIRLDIGAGYMTFSNGADDVQFVEGSDSNLSGNSIVLIDEAILSKTYYISRFDAFRIIDGSPAYFVGGDEYNAFATSEDADFIISLVKNNHNREYDMNGDMLDRNSDERGTLIEYPADIDGGLFIPFEPIDFTKHNKVNSLKLTVLWDLNDIFEAIEGDLYTLKEDADGTPFDFDIQVEIH